MIWCHRNYYYSPSSVSECATVSEEVLVRAGKGEETLLRLEKQRSRLPHRAEMCVCVCGGGIIYSLMLGLNY